MSLSSSYLSIFVIKNDKVSLNVSPDSSLGTYNLYLLIIDSIILENTGYNIELNIFSFSILDASITFFNSEIWYNLFLSSTGMLSAIFNISYNVLPEHRSSNPSLSQSKVSFNIFFVESEIVLVY